MPWNDAWTKAGGTGLTRISSISSGNTVELYAVGANGRISNASMNTTNGAWSAFAEVAGGLAGASDVAAAVAVAPSKVTLAAASNSTLFTQSVKLDTGASDLAVSTVNHTVHVQVIGADGALHAQSGDYLAGAWKPAWTKIGGIGLTRITSAPAANAVHVYAVSADGKVLNTVLDTTTGSWTYWRQIPGTLTSQTDLTATTNQ
ncbi:hypothetical protein AB0F18_17705 [Streptomyces sp. NPDC029216]|uniref:hypothetical protein n=1 Tax=Streptomyces sp. NPDC029216 TaxID=3154701 RepID=UPI0033D6F727